MPNKNNIKISNDDLLDAAAEGNIEIVRFILRKGADINTKNNIGGTALMLAAENGNTEIVNLLLDKGADINSKDKDGWGALIFAAQNGHTEIITLLLDKGVDINLKTNIGTTTLMFAAKNGHTETVTLLLDKGSDIHAKFKNGATALMAAARKGHTETVQLLIDKGANINAKMVNGKSALTVAIEKSKTEIVMLLIRNGAEIPEDKTALINILKETSWWSNGHLNIIENTPRNKNHEQDVSEIELAILFQNREYVQDLIDDGINYDNDKCLEIARNAKKYDLVDLFQQKRPEIKKEVIVIKDDNEPLHSSSLYEPLKRKYSQITASSSSDENQRKDLMLASNDIESENAELLLNIKQKQT